MLLTISYVAWLLYVEYTSWRRTMQFLAWTKNFTKSASLVFRNVNNTVLTLAESGRLSCLTDPISRGWKEEKLMAVGRKEVLAVTPQQMIHLNKWTAYLDAQLSWESSDIHYSNDKVHVLLEVYQPEDEESFLSRSFNIPKEKRVKVTDFAAPLAWKSGINPFGIVLSCSQENFTNLALAFIDGYLIMDDLLEIQEIITIKTEGRPNTLLRMSSNRSLNSDESPEGSKDFLDTLQVTNFHTKIEKSSESLHSIPEENCAQKVKDLQLNSNSQNLNQSASVSDMSSELPSGSESDNMSDAMKKSKRGISTKPPNILIYCGKADSTRKYQETKKLLSKSLNTNQYVIYNLKHDDVQTIPWIDNTELLFVCCERLYDDVDKEFLKYFYTGGKVVSFGSTFEKCFVRSEIAKSSKLPVISVLNKEQKEVLTIGGRAAYISCESVLTNVSSRVLIQDKTGNPVVLLTKCEESGGIAVLSQVLLDKDTKEVAISEEIFNHLKESEMDRTNLLAYILEEIGINCDKTETGPLTPACLLAVSEDSKSSFLTAVRRRSGKSGAAQVIKSSEMTLHFVSPGEEHSERISNHYLPVETDSHNLNFNFNEYAKNLKTSILGKVVLYSDVVTSTMNITDVIQFVVPENVGLVAIADRQTGGKGRGGNAWLSPQGCAQFTLFVQIPLSSKLGGKLGFIQHIAGLAAVHAVRGLPGYEDIEVRLKWPNDIYYKDEIKCGGVLVKSTTFQGKLMAHIGIGFNVNNSTPTICVNDMIKEYNCLNGSNLDLLTVEQVIGRIITCFEKLVEDFKQDGGNSFLKAYYKYWLHSNATVMLESENKIEVEIVGLDANGYLLVKDKTDSLISVQPDGNSFDMMRNLIAFKTR